jgi:hypothetical protein
MDMIERSKDILVGLKLPYEPFNDGFISFSSSVPSVSWMFAYSQSLDIENRKLKTEFHLSSFDYASISSYANSLRKKNAEVFISWKMSTFGIHRLDWLVVSKMFPWNAKHETIYRWFASFIVIYTIMELKS